MHDALLQFYISNCRKKVNDKEDNIGGFNYRYEIEKSKKEMALLILMCSRIK